MIDLKLPAPANGLWFTEAEAAAIRRIMNARFYRLRNDGGDGRERFWCKRHPFTPGVSAPIYHDFLSDMCVAKPFTWMGIQHMFATTRVGESRNFSRVTHGALDAARPPDLAAGHPRSARTLHQGEAGEQWLGFLLGTVEPIDAWQAQQDADEIRRRQRAARVAEPLIFKLQPLRLRNEALRGGA